MRYPSARSFRQALEDRLRSDYPRHKIPRLRKMIAFERFMVRLDVHWILKGGYALQLRTDKARATQDIDLLVQHISQDQVAETLLQAVHQDVGDYFEFSIERTGQELDFGSAIRFRVTARLAGRIFERFHIDVGISDPIVEPVEYLSPPPYLAFAGIPVPLIPCYPVTQHIAEKLHALVRPRAVETSRVRDLVDILLFACMDENLQAERLRAAIRTIFESRGDRVPAQLDQIPMSWRPTFNPLAKSSDLPFSDFQEAVRAARLFIDPILAETGKGNWDPHKWEWEGAG